MTIKAYSLALIQAPFYLAQSAGWEYGLAHDGPVTMVEIAAGAIIAILTCF